MIFTTGLLIYHFGLIRHNLTTKEELKNVYNNPFGNPFKSSIFKNIKSIICPLVSRPSLLEKMRANLIKTTIVEKEVNFVYFNFRLL